MGTPETIDVVWGTGSARTELGAFDRALADAGLAEYNLVTLSSIVPAGATVREVARLEPDRWPVGTIVAAVSAVGTAPPDGDPVAAGLGWAIGETGGVFAEATATGAEECRERLEARLADLREHRPIDAAAGTTRTVEHDGERATAAVVAAVYGPIELAGSTGGG